MRTSLALLTVAAVGYASGVDGAFFLGFAAFPAWRFVTALLDAGHEADEQREEDALIRAEMRRYGLEPFQRV